MKLTLYLYYQHFTISQRIGGLMVKSLLAMQGLRVRFPADALFCLFESHFGFAVIEVI